MNLRLTSVLLPLILAASFGLAAQAPPAKAPAPKAPAKRKQTVPKGPQVDINHASKEELKKLPGITDAYADRIIAGRPYLSKANLVTHGIIPDGVYEPIKHRIIAKQDLAKP